MSLDTQPWVPRGGGSGLACPLPVQPLPLTWFSPVFAVNFSCVPEEDVRRLISFVLEAQSSGVNAEKLDSTSDPSNWDFASSLFFSLTVVTTIGTDASRNLHFCFTNSHAHEGERLRMNIDSSLPSICCFVSNAIRNRERACCLMFAVRFVNVLAERSCSSVFLETKKQKFSATKISNQKGKQAKTNVCSFCHAPKSKNFVRRFSCTSVLLHWVQQN